MNWTRCFAAYICLALVLAAAATGGEPGVKTPVASGKSGRLFAPVILRGKRGYIDRTGKLVVRPQYAQAWPLSDGLACVVDFRGCYRYLNPSGREVLHTDFYWSTRESRFSEGRARMRVKRKWGYINKRGRLVIEPKYEDAADFSEGLAAVKLGDKSGDEGKWGYIDRSGKVIVPPTYSRAAPFSDGLAAVTVLVRGGGGLKEGGWTTGYIDRSGKTVIAPQFAAAGRFSEGLAPVWKPGRLGYFGYINKKGKLVIPARFDAAQEFSEGVAAVMVRKTSSGLRIRKWGFIDTKGNYAVKPTFEKAESFSEGLAGIKRGGKWGFIDAKGTVVCKPQFDEVARFSSGVARVWKGGDLSALEKGGKLTLVWKRSWQLPRESAKRSPPANFQLALSPLANVRAGQPITINITLKNVGRGPVRFPKPRWIDQFITTRITGPDGKTVILRHPSLSIGNGKFPGGDLKAGDSWKIQLSERNRTGNDRSVPIWLPSPGTYKIICFLDTTHNPAPWFPFWKGTAQSLPLTVRVKPDPPAVSNGLEVKIRALEAAFKQGKPLRFALTYRNTSKAPLTLKLVPAYGGRLPVGTTLEVELVAARPSWKPWKTLEHWPIPADAPESKAVRKTLKLGELFEEKISLGGSKYQFWLGATPSKLTNLQKALLPYWYRVVARVKVAKSAGLWSGKMTARSAEFKIGKIENSQPVIKSTD